MSLSRKRMRFEEHRHVIVQLENVGNGNLIACLNTLNHLISK